MTEAPKLIVKAMLGQRSAAGPIEPVIAVIATEQTTLLTPETVDAMIGLLLAEKAKAISFSAAVAANPALATAQPGGTA